MLSSGDVVSLDPGLLTGRGAGSRHPAIVVTAQAVLEAGANVVQVVPRTRIDEVRGNVRPVQLAAVLDVLGLILDIR